MALDPSRAGSSLQRNRACYHCRHRKIKCDGQRPVCGQCIRLSREEDCEYRDESHRSVPEVLEDNIARVRSRIHQLEHPELPSPGEVALQQPYDRRLSGVATSPRRRGGHASSSPVSPAFSTESDSADSQAPPPTVAEQLIATFLASSQSFGFFLNAENFRASALLPLPSNHPSKPTAALLAAVYLTGIALSDSAAFKAHEDTFRKRALSALERAHASTHTQRDLHTLQAHIIIAYYFLNSPASRNTETLFHSARAVSLAAMAGLFSVSGLRLSASSPLDLSQLVAEMDSESERIEACWAVVVLDRVVAAEMGTAPHWMRDVLTPWPGSTTSNASSGCTITAWLNGQQPFSPQRAVAPKELLSKATILWESATNLVARSHWRPGAAAGTTTFHTFFKRFHSLDARIEETRAAVLLSESSVTDDHASSIVVRYLVNGATIRLYAPFVHHLPPPQHLQLAQQTQTKSLSAARDILSLVTHDSGLIQSGWSSILAPVWYAALSFLLHMIRRSPSDVPVAVSAQLRREFDEALVALRARLGAGTATGPGVTSRRAGYYLERIQSESSDAQHPR
ncbi:hypothetical protein MKEN_01248100 [Mycena kentingensis (nom. inval.)]|nr:hypothetical protein MKEN_01248100 [Mycena kentingensis (nom. inval.)]